MKCTKTPIPYATPLLRKHKRKCLNCGKDVCSYKDPTLKQAYCYSCDHLQPWTYRVIVGREKTADEKRWEERLMGPGHTLKRYIDMEEYNERR